MLDNNWTFHNIIKEGKIDFGLTKAGFKLRDTIVIYKKKIKVIISDSWGSEWGIV